MLGVSGVVSDNEAHVETETMAGNDEAQVACIFDGFFAVSE